MSLVSLAASVIVHVRPMTVSMPSRRQQPISSKPLPPSNVSLADGPAIVRLARELADRRGKASLERFLAGKNLAVVSVEAAATDMFCAAAQALGARVSQIQPSLTEYSDPEAIRQTARVLGKLYAGVEWPHIAARLQERLEKEAAIPVFNGISMPGHPLMNLSNELDIEGSVDVKRLLLIQALLLRRLQ
jgi:ornithine carbamoyltransferase